MNKNVTLFLGSLILMLFSASVFGQAPVITLEPSPRGVLVGMTATFWVEASGDSLNYQWYLNDSPITGANNSSYTTPTTTIDMNGDEYIVVVANSHGADTSKMVNLFVTATNKRVTSTQVVYYNFKEKSGSLIKDGATLTNPLNLTINKTSAIDWSNYGLYVSGGAQIISTNTSASARVIDAVRNTDELTIEMWVRPLTTSSARIIDMSTSKTNINFGVENYPGKGYNFLVRTTNTNSEGKPGIVDEGNLQTNIIHLTFTHSAEGFSKIYRNGTEVESDTITGLFSNWVYGSRLTLGSFRDYSVPWEGIYYLVVIYERALDSLEVVHNYTRGWSGLNAPFIIQQPENVGALEGYSANFSVGAVGSSLSYQWQENGVNISGATDAILTIPSITLSDSGNLYRAIVSNGSGIDTSDAALLEVRSQNADCPANIIHYYRLEESGSPYNDEIGFADGTSSNAPLRVEGAVDSAQSFSSQANINLPDDITFDWGFDDSFSIEFLMKTGVTPSTNQVVIGRDDASTDLHWWIGINTSGRAVFQLNSTAGQGISIGNENPAVNDSAWHLITAVRNESLNRNYLYIDGNKVDSADINYAAGFEGVVPINIGYLNLSPFYYYQGVLDELAFYNIALEPSEIQEHYTKVMAGIGYCVEFPTIAAPTNLTAILNPADTSKVNLSWEDNSPDELGFIIQRAEGSSDTASAFVSIGTVAADIIVYSDTTTDTSTTYTYRVYAYNADTVSNFSNLAEITTKVPVELTAFRVSTQNGKVLITWETATETNNSGFIIQRKDEKGKFGEIAFIKGGGTKTDKSVYSYVDKDVLYGKYSYRLKQIDFDGSYIYSSTVEVDLGMPKEFTLAQNYPNPFNPTTKIMFTLPANAKVTMKVYNTLGQEVAQILSSELAAGIHEAIFDATELSSGVYFYRLEAAGADGSNFVSMKRMLLIK